MGPGLSGKGVCFFWAGAGWVPFTAPPHTNIFLLCGISLYYNFQTFCYTLLLNPCEQKKLRHVEIRKKNVYQLIWRGQLSTSWVVVP